MSEMMIAAQTARHVFERDIDFGQGFDYSTMSYVLRPGPTARIVRFDPNGVNSGPTTISGRDHYVRNTPAGCRTLISAVTGTGA